MKRLIHTLLLFLLMLPALAQDKVDPEEEKSIFLTYVEDQLSTPNRRISISGIEGVLSSNARVGRITIADREGVWLSIQDAEIVWTRSALLRGHLEIDGLAAGRIEISRRPLPEDGAVPSPEAAPFSVPELPVSVALGELAVGSVVFGEGVFGLASELKVAGSLSIDGGSLAADFDIERVDGPGGTLDLAATLDAAANTLDLNFLLREPENGVVANLFNFHGRPAVVLSLAGSGPVDDLELQLQFDANERRVLTGRARIAGADGGKRFSAFANGPVGELVNPLLRDLFGDESNLEIAGTIQAAGNVAVERFVLDSGALVLAGSGETAADGFPTRIRVDGQIRAAQGRPVVLPVPGATTSLDSADIRIDFGGADVSSWDGEVRIRGFANSGLAAETFDLALGGATLNLADPARREVTVVVDGRVSGLSAEDADLAEAIGNSAGLKLNGAWRAGQPFVIEGATLDAKALSVSLAGEVSDLAFAGEFTLRTPDAGLVSEATGHDLSGALSLTGKGSIAPVSGAFDLILDGVAEDLAFGNRSVDRLLAGKSRLTGQVARDDRGLSARELSFQAERLSVRADGTFGTEAADMRMTAAITDLAAISDAMSGGLEAVATAIGTDGRIRLEGKVSVPEGTLSGKTLAGGEAGFNGLLAGDELTGTLRGRGRLGGEPVELDAEVALRPEGRRIDGLTFVVGPSRLTGAVAGDADGLYTGGLAFSSPDISTIAALFLTEARGRASGEIELRHAAGRQDAAIKADLAGIRSGQVSLGVAGINLSLTDLRGVPGADGTISARDARIAGLEISALTASATQRGDTTDMEAGLRFANGASLAALGAVSRLDDGYRVRINNADLVKDAVLARLVEPGDIVVSGDTVTVRSLLLDVSGGRISARGEAGERLDMTLDLARVPLGVANAVRPDLGLSGVVDGKVTIGGTRNRPDVAFDLQGRGIGAAELRRAGLPEFSIDATGKTSGDDLRVDAALRGAGGIDLEASGTLPLARGEMAMDVLLRAFPLAVLESVAPGRGLGGRLSGKARLGGTYSRPKATFDLEGTGIRAKPLADAGIGELEVAALGNMEGDAVNLTTLRARSSDGLALAANGRIPLAGRGLALAIDGTALLSLANRFLSGGASASGTLRLDVNVTGSLADPAISGTASLSDGAYSDPLLNVGLRRIAADLAFNSDRIDLRSVNAAVAAGGTIAGRGSIGIDPQAGFPADLTIRLANARYVDGALVAATLSGDLAVSGGLTRDPLISGTITIDRAELLVPETLGSAELAVDVKHVNPPKNVARTVALARADDGTPVPSARPSVARLDVSVVAGNRIFVRGRGLDAELGGSVRLTGPVTSIRPVGGFQLIRGRLSILGKRIVFDRGEITLVGDLDPFLDFVATSQADDVTVIITVEGRASDPAIIFSSQPQLPQDEVLARLIFGRSIAELSVLQVAKLAASAAALAGGGNASLLDGFRQATGLDELDIVTDSGGNAAVRAGRYVQDNIYFGVEAGTSGETRATVNIDLTDDLKARGQTGSDGNSSLGIFFEKDY